MLFSWHSWPKPRDDDDDDDHDARWRVLLPHSETLSSLGLASPFLFTIARLSQSYPQLVFPVVFPVVFPMLLYVCWCKCLNIPQNSHSGI